MKKQTAVEYLIKEISDILGKNETKVFQDLLLVDAITKAKELEKMQHQNTWFDSTLQFDNSAEMPRKKLFEQYFNETYN